LKATKVAATLPGFSSHKLGGQQKNGKKEGKNHQTNLNGAFSNRENAKHACKGLSPNGKTPRTHARDFPQHGKMPCNLREAFPNAGKRQTRMQGTFPNMGNPQTTKFHAIKHRRNKKWL